MNNDVIAVGFSVERRDIHLLCTEAGLNTIPPARRVDTQPGGSGYRDAFVALDNISLVALRLMGVLSERDVSGMLKRLNWATSPNL